MNILVFGKFGQIAIKLSEIFIENNAKFVSTKECDFSNAKNVEFFLENLKIKPQIIINATGYTKVEDAENNFESANEINAKSVEKIAIFCQKNDILLIHYSTDYVFNGNKKGFFNEKDDKFLIPLNKYGITKFNGENYIKKICTKYYIIRISWIYSEYGKNFFLSILKLLKEKQKIEIISDQIGSPTYSGSVAKITKLFIEKIPEYGIYHFCDKNFMSWYDFAKKIKKKLIKYNFLLKNEIIEPILSENYFSKIKRPKNSRFNTTKIINHLNIKLQTIENSLDECIKKLIIIKNKQ